MTVWALLDVVSKPFLDIVVEGNPDVTVNEHHPILASDQSEVNLNSSPGLSLWSIFTKVRVLQC